jgi:hypothetical protein
MEASEIAKLLTRKGELEALLNGFEKWLIFFGVLVAIGVAGESIWGFRAWWNNRKLHAVAESVDNLRRLEITNIGKDTEKLRFAISESAERIALAEQHAAEANRIAEGERLARVKIEEKIAPRRLSAEQIRTVADKLRRFTGQRINFFATAGDAEAIGIADDILKALNGPNSAGWFPTLSAGQYSSLVGSGIVIELSSDADARAREAAVTLADALRGERLAVLGPQLPPNMQTMVGNINNDPQARIRLVVAKKP